MSCCGTATFSALRLRRRGSRAIYPAFVKQSCIRLHSIFSVASRRTLILIPQSKVLIVQLVAALGNCCIYTFRVPKRKQT